VTKTALQVAAIALGVFVLSMVAHKAHADISLIAAKYSGGEFWLEVARYLIRNLAGGGKAPDG
jgi:hypothetical protein